MDKRVLLTMAAMVAFFVAVNALYPVFFPPPPRPVKTDAAAGPQAASTVGGRIASDSIESFPSEGGDVLIGEEGMISAVESDAAPAKAPYRDITVETPEYVAVFNERGGRLISLTLKNYMAAKVRSDDPDEPQQLIPQLPAQLGASLALVIYPESQNDIHLDGMRFAAETDSLEAAEAGFLEVPDGSSKELVMLGRTSQGLVIERRFLFSAGSYLIGQKVTLRNQSSGVYGARLGQFLANGPAVVGRRGRYDAVAGYFGGENFNAASEKAPSKLPQDGTISQADWLGYMSQYFLAAMVLSGGDPVLQEPARLRLQGFDKSNGQVQLVASWPFQLEPGTEAAYDFSVYFGPKETEYLSVAGHGLGRSIDLGWFWFLAKPMAWLLRSFYSIVGNYGVAIIIVTILIKIALWPLTAKSYKSMKQMQKLQPLLVSLRERHKDDRETMNKEMMKLYKAYHVNPMGGCLPMLLQIPFFIAFYRVLDYALELRGAPFMLWIQDLSAPDRLFDLGVKIPFLDPPTGIPVLTIIMTASMIWQQKLTPTMGDPMQAKMMMLMPIVFAIILINMPAGLVLYWLVNNVLSIFQQKLINRPAPSSPQPVKADKKPAKGGKA